MRKAIIILLSGCASIRAGPLAMLQLVTRDHVLKPRNTGFQLIHSQAVEKIDLTSDCKAVLGQTIRCDDYVASLGAPEYHGSLENEELTDSVCTKICETALTSAQRRILGACADSPELTPGYPLVALVDSVLNGWNETCLRDPDSSAYCNDIIDSWEDYEDISDMTKDQLCSFCFGAKLRMMQESPFSAYDEYFQEMLEYVNKECGTNGPTSPQLPTWTSKGPDAEDRCQDTEPYIVQEGDTCDSIAVERSISAASLYYMNPDLLDCSAIKSNQTLCLPASCETTHQVQENDDCVRLGVDSGASWLKLISWNLGLDSRCTNMWATEPFWGRTICVSQPGGEFVDDGGVSIGPGNVNLGGEGGSGDGYADDIATLPEGDVAEGTTTYCGHWVQADIGTTCSRILVSAASAIPIGVFLEANPSLGSASECDGKLEYGLWYCLLPYRYWKNLEDAKDTKTI